jgi:GH24 family phage-related lysozyme (muramidase)
MVKVPEYQPSVQTRPIFQSDFTVRANAEDMGAPAARGVEAMGRGIGQLARGVSDLGDAFAAIQDLEDTTRAKEADNNYAAWVRERMYGDNGFMTLEGKSAVDGRRAFEAEAEQKRKEFGGDLTPGAQRRYSDASQARLQSVLERSIVHTANQRKQWVKDASAARLDTFAEDALAAYGDPRLVDKNIAAGQAEIREQAKLLGWDADTTKNREAEFVSSVRVNVAMRTMIDDPVAAKAYYEKHKDQITGPHQMKFDEAVKIPLLNENVKRNTDKFMQSVGVGAASSAKDVVRGFEGYRDTPYWDVNAYRIGFGSDTVTKADGSVVRVTPGMKITRADAERDLQRRLTKEFIPGIIKMVGQDKWSRLPGPAQAALASVAYNYGSLPFIVANAVVMGDIEDIAQAVESLKGHNAGVNEGRRMKEAAIIRGMTGISIQSAAAMPSFGSIEEYLKGIDDPQERELTRKAIYAQLEAAKKAEQAQREAYQAEAFNLIETDNINPFELPPSVTTAIGMDGMSSLMTYWEKKQSGQEIETDPQLLYDMQTLYATNPAEFGKINLMDYKTQLSDEDWKTVNGWRQNALTDQRKAQEDGITLTSAFSQASTQLEAVGITTVGKEGKSRQEAADRIARFQNVLAQELEAFKRANDGKAPTQMDIQSMINRLLLPIVIRQEKSMWNPTKTPWSSTFGQEGFLFEAGMRPDGSTVDVDVQYSDIPIDLRRGIARDLERELGRKPSDDEVVDRYEQVILDQ